MGLLTLVLGGLFFPSCFIVLVTVLKTTRKATLNDAALYAIALRVISSLQAVIACCVGAVIVSSCHDVLYDRHWLANSYTWFGAPYFYYDTWAMYLAYWYRTPKVQEYPWSKAFREFLKTNKVMMVHHLILPMFFVPTVVWWRQGIGDFFVGCFFLIELAIPCISLRAVMLQFKQEKTVLYAVNGIVTIVTFAVCRILIFPFMFWSYGRQIGASILDVPMLIPKKCTIACLLLLVLQTHWLVYMVKVAIRNIYMRLEEARPRKTNQFQDSEDDTDDDDVDLSPVFKYTANNERLSRDLQDQDHHQQSLLFNNYEKLKND